MGDKKEEIKPYSKNAKKHPDKQLRQIANSLKEFGWQQPIVVDKEGVIIVGHGRWEAYKRYPEGIKDLWIKKEEALTSMQVKAYRLADNKLNESDWDMEIAIEELKELPEDLFKLTGFDMIDEDEKIDGDVEFTDEILNENNYVVFKFNKGMDFNVVENFLELKTTLALDSKKGYRRGGVGRVVDGSKLLKLIEDANSNS